MPKVCAIIGAKGGTTKTSTTAALTHLFVRAGANVAAADLDPQGSLTRRLDLPRPTDPLSAFPLPIDLDEWGDASGSDACGVLLRGGRALEGASEDALSRHLERVTRSEVDLVLIDTPPALGPAVRAAIRAADLVLIPCTPGRESLDGYTDMARAAASIAPATPVRAVLVLAHLRSRILKWSKNAFATVHPGALLPAVVPFEVAASEAGVLHLPVTVSAPDSRSAAAYREIARAVARELHVGVTITDPEV